MGKNDLSAQAFREALLVQPESDEAMSGLAGQCVKLGRPEEAIMYYKKAIEIYPDNPGVLYQLGILYFKQGKNAEALASFQRTIQLAPGTEIAASSEKYINLLK
jgi:tetratricopeptide (TPR) repeat protein